MPCIYAVQHKETGFAYVGVTMGNVKRRMSGHIHELKNGRHSATGLQDAFDADGLDAFVLLELEQLSSDASVVDKRVAELYWMQKYGEKLYNHTQVSFGIMQNGKGIRTGSVASQEANEKRRMAQIGKPKREGHGAKISATKLRLGQKPSLETARAGGIATCKLRWSGSKP